ncbi:hypothetical protein CCR90_03090 [Rhodovulum sulfidophilum]|uniref:mevalonate kinase family protein n=1 Tax=Rhodovulum sulfidophilum TaxID=35806 RepID=UPI0005A691FC|nr:hypothetical protein [Rhodovulum sulfidophilum]ANB35634.1 hypothetical protein A6W98_17125 [Rhodovulum sulfidophilum DSM 1374]ANB39456.1 hypothetical protein A6024_16980 [Rhodovulum sulfidophilum]MBK5922779.1 hypothetical protein [Rhodovulum sulfidophilum]MCW2302734.1 mevalonate kinase [Rhodovulum sulfidophilum]
MSAEPVPATLPEDASRAHAPGKIILSGEHAVVYGAPALAVAVAIYTEVWFRPIHPSDGLKTVFEQVSQGAFYPLSRLGHFKQSLDRRFDSFLRGELKVQQILQRPDDLIVYTLMSLAQRLPMPGKSPGHCLPVPGQLGGTSALPLGAGMGSSASIIAATMVLYETLLDRLHSTEERFEWVRFCERLQHGKGGAIDAAAVTHGGAVRVQGDSRHAPAIAPGHGIWRGDGWYWVLHGKPDSSTGECVAAVREAHGDDQALWQGFEACTDAFQAALETDSSPLESLRENHRLLRRIGVVPEAAARFVEEVELAGGAAKICGAGSIRGDHGGVILVHQPDAPAMARLMEGHPDLRWAPLHVAPAGAAFGAPQ